MALQIKPETEELVHEEIRNGNFSSVDDLIVQGVIAWRERFPKAAAAPRRTPAEAIAHIRKSRGGSSLGGLRIKDLMNEGRP
jgi:Arc/MetJ-type ribon-helix-helix transcriptional regulator